MRYGLVVLLRLLSTLPHGNAVTTVGFRSGTSTWKGLAPFRSNAVAGALALDFLSSIFNLRGIATAIRSKFDAVRQTITKFLYQIADRIGLGNFLLLRHVKKELETRRPSDTNLSPDQLRASKDLQAKSLMQSQDAIRQRLGLQTSTKRLEISLFEIKNGKLVAKGKINPALGFGLTVAAPCDPALGDKNAAHGKRYDSGVLRQNLRSGNYGPKDGPPSAVTSPASHAEAHHLVEGNRPSLYTKKSLDILFNACIGINDAVNGIFLPKSKNLDPNPQKRTYHSYTFCTGYQKWVYDLLANTNRTAAQVKGKLYYIRNVLRNGGAPWIRHGFEGWKRGQNC